MHHNDYKIAMQPAPGAVRYIILDATDDEVLTTIELPLVDALDFAADAARVASRAEALLRAVKDAERAEGQVL